MLAVVLLFGLLCAFVAAVVRTRIKEAKAHKLPPAFPGELPIIGHTHLMICDTRNLWLLIKKVIAVCKNAGGVIHAKIAFDTYYLITDPEDALAVFNTCWSKHFVYDFGKNWLGQSMIPGSGNTYLRHRKLLHPGFSSSIILGYMDVFNCQAKKLVSEMHPHMGNGPFDPTPLFKNMALETSCITTFGCDVEDKEFLHTYMEAVESMLHIGTQRFQKFYLQSNFVYKLLGYQKKEDGLIYTLNKLSNEIIQQKKEDIRNDNLGKNQTDSRRTKEVPYKPYIDYMLEIGMAGLLTDKEIREEADNNIVATFDTASYTLANMAVLLGTYPEVQEKIYEEMMQTVGPDRDVEKEDLQGLPYTKAVVKETLRVIPTVPALLRFVDKEVKLKNYTLRPNSQCVILTMGMHHHEVWGPDATEFKPERWLDPTRIPKCSGSFAGFGIGKRPCVGNTYGIAMLATALVFIVRKYKWTADASKLEMRLDMTLKAISGQEIDLQERK